jgi:hypothetical protein
VNAILPGLVDTPMGTGQPAAMLDFVRGLHSMRLACAALCTS